MTKATGRPRGRPLTYGKTRTVRIPLAVMAEVLLIINQFKSKYKKSPPTT